MLAEQKLWCSSSVSEQWWIAAAMNFFITYSSLFSQMAIPLCLQNVYYFVCKSCSPLIPMYFLHFVFVQWHPLTVYVRLCEHGTYQMWLGKERTEACAKWLNTHTHVPSITQVTHGSCTGYEDISSRQKDMIHVTPHTSMMMTPRPFQR